MFWQEYQCDLCGRLESVKTTIIAYYRLDDGRSIPGMNQAVWCYRCDGVRSAERLVDADWLESLIDHLRNSGIDDDLKETASLLEKTPEAYLAEKLDMYVAMLQWRRGRNASARCWNCGATEFLELAPDPTNRWCPLLTLCVAVNSTVRKTRGIHYRQTIA